MSQDLAISLLKKGSTGEEILQILDTIALGIDSEFDSVPLAELAQD
jgi:hypothetical protein